MDRPGDRKNWIKWFTDFLNADLRTLSRMEEGRLAGDIHLILISQQYSEEVTPEGLILGERARGVQAGSDEMRKMLLAIRKHAETMSTRIIDLEGFQEYLRVFYRGLMSNIGRVQDSSGDLLLTSVAMPITVFLRVGPSLMASTQESAAVDNFPLTLTFTADSDKNTLLLFFIKTLEGIPLNSFHACDECGKWFIQLSKKKKRFCSGRCAARSGMRDGRKQRQKGAESDEEKRMEYQKELEEKAARAHDAYDAKIKKITGNPNVKVERRPIKYSKKED